MSGSIADCTSFGSALMTPSTSVQISIAAASSALPTIVAV